MVYAGGLLDTFSISINRGRSRSDPVEAHFGLATWRVYKSLIFCAGHKADVGWLVHGAVCVDLHPYQKLFPKQPPNYSPLGELEPKRLQTHRYLKLRTAYIRKKTCLIHPTRSAPSLDYLLNRTQTDSATHIYICICS